jgi:biotin synthase
MFTKSEIIDLVEKQDAKATEILCGEADRVRKENVGDEVHLRGLIEFSNYCRRDCLFCGLRRSNKNVMRYRMAVEEIFDQARLAKHLDFKTVVLQSGEDHSYSIKEICSLVERIKSELGLAITLSIGERTYGDYESLKKSGADRYLMRFETSSRTLFEWLKPDSDYGMRFQCLQWLRELGYQVGSGIMVGLPEQSPAGLAEDILKFRELDLDMIGLGPFIASPDTPLHDQANGGIDMVLRVTALTRIVTRNTHIPATAATGTIDPEGRQKALRCGANVVMPNLTPSKYREHYLIYPDKICIGEEPLKCRSCVEGMVLSLGRTIAKDAGHSLKTSLN